MVYRHPNCSPTHLATCSHIGVIGGHLQMFAGWTYPTQYNTLQLLFFATLHTTSMKFNCLLTAFC